MAKIEREQGELSDKLKQQIVLLQTANKNFDSGIEDVGLQIATTIRVLLHDTKSSKSLLKQLNLKGIDFFETSFDITPNAIHLGLIIKFFDGVVDGQGGNVLYKPIFTSDFHFKNKTWVSFEDWWEKIIFSNIDGTTLTRKQLVLYIANQEGGAHIDPKINSDYEIFSHSYSGGIKIVGSNSGVEREFDNIPVLPSIRQISFELIETFKKKGIIS